MPHHYRIVLTKLLTLLLAFSLSLCWAAGEEIPTVDYVYHAKITRVKDGDTVVADIDLGLHTWRIGETLRLLRVDAPETYRPKTEEEREKGNKVTAFLMQEVLDDDTIIVRTVKSDSFGRFLAEIWDAGGNVNDRVLRFMKDNNLEKD